MAVTDMPIALAHLLGFGVGLLLYGAYTIIFAITIRFLGMRTRTSKSRVVFSTILALFLTTTTTLVLSVIDNVNGFATYRDGAGAEAYFKDSQNGLRVAKDLLLLIAALLADGLICWRLYVIWSRSFYVLIAPGILLFAEAVVGLLTVGFEFHEVVHPDGRFQTVFRVGSVFICICSALVNVLVTSLIVGRLWRVGRRVEDMTDRGKYTRIIRVLIESGFIYTATIIAFLICVVANLRGAFVFVDYIVTVSVAIAPTLIVLHLNYATHRVDPQDSNAAIPSTSIRFQSPSIRDADDLSLQATADYDYGSYSRDVERPVDRYTMQPTIKYRRSVPSRLHSALPKIDVNVPPPAASSTSLASPSTIRLAKGRLRMSTSQPSFRAGSALGQSDVSLAGSASPQGGDAWIPLSRVLERGRDAWRSIDLEVGRGPLLSPEDFRTVGAGPSSTAVDGDQGHEPTELLPPLPSPVLPSPTIASRPSLTFAERARRPSILERPSQEALEMQNIGSAV